MKMALVFASLFFLSTVVFAKETDNLTGRYKQLEDSTEVLDAEMNRRLNKLVDDANSKNVPCSKPIQIRQLFYQNNGPNFMLTGALEAYAEDNEKVAKRKVSVEGSIYKDVFTKRFFFDKISLASTIKVNGELIGTDKLGHFIDQGFEYYTPYRQRNYDMYETLRSSRGSESINGKNSTGMVSKADLMANYKGIIFYHNLAEGSSPYLRCVNGQWLKHREFSWSEYVDAGWDEGINCSLPHTSESAQAYEANIQKLEAQAKRNGKEQNYRCPIDREACLKLYEKEGRNEVFLLSEPCRTVAKEMRKQGYTSRGSSASSLSSSSKSGNK